MKQLGISREHFCRLFKKITGKTFVAHLILLRLAHAQMLLRTTSLPIIEISGECGFADLSHFNRLFKKATGVTPTTFRKCYLPKSR